MTTVLVCTSDERPCPEAAQSWAPVASMADPADWGVTSASVGEVYVWGVGSVLALFWIGYAVGTATGIIRKV